MVYFANTNINNDIFYSLVMEYVRIVSHVQELW